MFNVYKNVQSPRGTVAEGLIDMEMKLLGLGFCLLTTLPWGSYNVGSKPVPYYYRALI